ncbi:MAG: FlgD immunoglobulin-like domain containing protein [Kiritimatiellia bacterium]
MSSGDASLLQPLVQLGLCPRIRLAAGLPVQHPRDPRNVDIVWDANDVLAAGKLSGKLLMGSGKTPAVAHTFKGDNRVPEILSLGHLPDGVTGNGILAATGSARGPVVWTVETGYGDKGSFRWPLQSFLSTPPSMNLSRGGNMPVGKNGGSLTSPARNLSATATSQGVNSVFDGRKVLGGEVHRIGCYAGEDDEGMSDFPEPVDLELAWGEQEDPGGATPGIYWLDPGEKRWKLVGTTPAGDRRVRASITHCGAYALMIDAFPPALEEVHAWPNPFLSRQTNTAWRLEAVLSEPALVSVRILDATGRVVRVLADKQMMEHGDIAFSWNGLDAGGRRVPDGHYTYEMNAWDESGLAAPPVTGGVAVFNSGFGAVSGRVTASRENAARPVVALRGFSLPALVKDGGEYLFPAVPPGAMEAVFQCPGHFDEVRPVKAAGSGPAVRMDEVQLSHLAMGGCRASAVLFSPDGDGTNDFVSLSYTWTRRCEYEVAVFDGEGALVKTLRPRQAATPGPDALAWSGDDDYGKPLPGGWYKVAWTAYNRDEAIPQAEVRVLLDRGLIQYASALPYLFSPNGDGFDDTLQVGFNLEQSAEVSLAVLGLDGTRLHAVTNAVALAAGWHTLEWDGRGRGGRMLPDGRYQFELTPVYAGGYTSKVVRGEFQSDSVPPEIGQVSPANGSVVREAMPRISARILSRLDDIDPDQLKFKIDENTVEAGEVDLQRGTFAYTPKTSLGPGVHIAIAYAQDWAGNYAPPQAVSFTIAFGEDPAKPVADRQPPEILSLSPAKNAKVYGDTPLLTARVRDLGDGLDPDNIRLTINGELQANSVQRFIPGKSGKAWDWYYYQKAMLLFDPLEGEIRYVPITPLPAGKTVVTLEVQDKAGNRSAKAESVFEVVVDREAPTVEITQPPNGAVLSRPPRLLLARIADAGPGGVNTNSFRCLVDNREVKAPPGGFPFDPATGILQIPLAETLARDAQHLVAVSARDRAGNLSQTAISAFALVSDAEAPRVDLLLPSGSERFEAGFPVTIAAAVYDPGRAGLDPDGVELLLNGKAVAPYDFKAGRPGYVLSQNLLKHTFEQLPAGHYVLEIRCRDRAGNAAAPVACTFDVLAR